MFKYLILNLLFMTLAAMLCYSLRRHVRWRTDSIVLAVVLVMTAVFDSLLIAVGIFDYRPQHILGIFIGKAPIEDFAYALCAVILAIPLWRRLRKTDET